MSSQLIVARFEISSWDEAQLPGVEGDWASGAKMKKTFSGEVSGSSQGLFISSGKDEGSRGYIATERVTLTFPDGRSGSLTVQHGGLEASPESWFGHIVPGSGTGDFAGLSGSAAISHDDQGAYFTFVLS
jgi:hypothetical protein